MQRLGKENEHVSNEEKFRFPYRYFQEIDEDSRAMAPQVAIGYAEHQIGLAQRSMDETLPGILPSVSKEKEIWEEALSRAIPEDGGEPNWSSLQNIFVQIGTQTILELYDLTDSKTINKFDRAKGLIVLASSLSSVTNQDP